MPHPASPAFKGRVTDWLLDLCPPQFRDEPLLQRHPVVLVRLVHRSVAAQGRGVDQALAGLRAELSDLISAPVMQETIDILLRQRDHLLVTRREVALVEHVLRGGEFTEQF